MYFLDKMKPIIKAGLLPIAMFSQLTWAIDPASSIGQSSSSTVDIKKLFEQFFGWGEVFVDLFGVFGVLAGLYIIYTSVFKIINISTGRVQGSVPMYCMAFLIGLFMMAFTTWSFFFAGSVINQFK